MTSHPTLFALAEAASTISVAGEKAKEFDIGHFDDQGKIATLRTTMDDYIEYHFADQQVSLLANGEVDALAEPDPGDDLKTQYRLRFTVERPIALTDVSDLTANKR